MTELALKLELANAQANVRSLLAAVRQFPGADPRLEAVAETVANARLPEREVALQRELAKELDS